jgi:hypothetical protein
VLKDEQFDGLDSSLLWTEAHGSLSKVAVKISSQQAHPWQVTQALRH